MTLKQNKLDAIENKWKEQFAFEVVPKACLILVSEVK